MAKKAVIQYRHMKTDELGSGFNLRDVISDVLHRSVGGRQLFESATRRTFDMNQDGSVVILNKIAELGAGGGRIFAGQLIYLGKGGNLPSVSQPLDVDTEEFVLENLALPETTKILRGAMYFAIVDNHAAFIEGQAVKGRMLERYLSKLLQDAGEFEPGQEVTLMAKFPSLDGKGVQSPTELTLRAGRSVRDPGKDREDLTTEREAASKREKGGTVFEVLGALGWSDAAIAALEEQIPDGGWVEGLFRIFIKSKRKRQAFSRASIGEALRNVDPADIGLKGDGTEKGGLVKLSSAREVKTIEDLLDPTDAMVQIVEALKELGESREDRLQNRLTHLLPAAVAVGATLFVPPGMLHGDMGRFVVTFLGLIAASILPTISLLVGSMTSVGRSVLRITQLRDEFSDAVSELWSILVSIAFAVGGVALSAVDPSAYTSSWPSPEVRELVFLWLQTVGTGIFFAFAVDAVVQLQHIPTVIRRALEIKYEIAVEEARKRTEEKAPNKDEIAEKFGTAKGFGAVISVKVPDKVPQ